MSDNLLSLYDAHAPRLYALALRITGDAVAAAEVLEQVFVDAAADAVPSDVLSLVRAVRERSLTRQGRSELPTVESAGGASPQTLIDDAFFGGMTVAQLARRHALSEDEVRARLRTGMTGLRAQFGRGEK